MSVFPWGPSGVGKTAPASIASDAPGTWFVGFSVVTTGVRELRAKLGTTRQELEQGISTVPFTDEMHRFSKTQQDALLPVVGNRAATLTTTTTENPSFSVISLPLLCSLLLRLKPLTDTDIPTLVSRTPIDEWGLTDTIALVDVAQNDLMCLAGGDARCALTYLEKTAASAGALGLGEITPGAPAHAVDRAAIRYDRDGDQHYDVTFAPIKSVRDSDVDTVLHYLVRVLEAGEDPRFIAHRLMISAGEDIGMATFGVLGTCVAAVQTVQLPGMPEACIAPVHAAVAAVTAPKSNAAYVVLKKAVADTYVGRGGAVPAHLEDTYYASAKALRHGEGYVYPHGLPSGVVTQQYPPDGLAGISYYQPTGRGSETAISERMAAVRRSLGR